MHRLWRQAVEPLLDASRPRLVVEIGSDDGRNTTNLIEWCRHHGARLEVIDPLPKYDAEEWSARFGDVMAFHAALAR